MNHTTTQAIRNPALSAEDQKMILERALTSRFVEESLLTLFSEGKLHGTVHTCIGQELTGGVVAHYLKDGDTIFSNHRCHGHFISRSGDIGGLIAELMGRKTGVSGGLGGSQHLYKEGFYSNGIQGGIVPVAAGLAMGHKQRNGANISVVFIGDGTLGEGVVYETLNIVSKWTLPLLIILEDNQYSQSTAQEETLAGDIDARAAAFGIETLRGSTWEWEALCATVSDAVAAMRNDRRPRFLHVETYRLKAHSKGDDTRPRALVEPFERRDPLNVFLAQASTAERAWVEGLKARVSSAVIKASSEPIAELPPIDLIEGNLTWSTAKLPDGKRVVSALNEEFKRILAQDASVILLGEDILSPYGGAFKVTAGTSDQFPDRVFNAPISEAAIVGIGAGLGLSGFRPVVEIMFGDFVGLAFDQIVNHAAKFHQMYDRKVTTNLIVRTPMGGRRGYGPTHSQTLDKHFLGVPGLRVLAMNAFTEPGQLYGPLFAGNTGPTLVIENKQLYGSYFVSAPPDGYQLVHSSEVSPTAWLKPDADQCDVTLLGYGGMAEPMLEASERLFEEHDIVAQILCVMQIYPFSIDCLLGQLTAAPHLIVVEEGQGFAGFGAEVLSQLAERGALAGMKVGRLYPPAHCIPSSGPLEKEVLPGADEIVEAVLKQRNS